MRREIKTGAKRNMQKIARLGKIKRYALKYRFDLPKRLMLLIS
jgi:hypothetical protein